MLAGVWVSGNVWDSIFFPPTFANQMYSLQHFFSQEHLVRHQCGVTWKQLCTQPHHIAHTRAHAHTLQSLLKDRTLSFSKIPGWHARELAYFSTVLNTCAHSRTVLYTSSVASYHWHCHPLLKPPSHQVRLKSVSHNEQPYKVQAGC